MVSKLKQKGRAILRSKKSYHFPEYSMLDTKLSMIKNLNFYSLEVDEKDKQAFALAYWKSIGKDVRGLEKLGTAWFSTVGAVAHMVHIRGLELELHDVIRLDTAYVQLREEAAKLMVPKSTSTTVTDSPENIQDRINSMASKHIGEIEHALDLFVAKGEPFDVKAYIQSNGIKAPIAKKIGAWFKNQIPEFAAAYKGSDKDLVEAYSHLGKKGLRKTITFLEELVATCNNMAIIARTTRAPRMRKAQPPAKLVAKMKYLKEFAAMGMKSVHPEKIIGSTEIWLFDTARRRLIKYQAQEGSELSVKGTTIMNFSPEKSGSKILRKPDEQLKNVADMTKRPMNGLFNEIKGTIAVVRGRTSSDQLILKAF